MTTTCTTTKHSARSRIGRRALGCAFTVALVIPLTAGQAAARVERPEDNRAVVPASAKVTATLLPGSYGVHVDGGWLLR